MFLSTASTALAQEMVSASLAAGFKNEERHPLVYVVRVPRLSLTQVAPGMLITFLQKGLAYVGIEEHLNEVLTLIQERNRIWKQYNDEAIANGVPSTGHSIYVQLKSSYFLIDEGKCS